MDCTSTHLIISIKGRTIRRVIASISEHPVPLLKFKWEQLYVLLSRVKHSKHLQLLLTMRDRSTLQYIMKLEKDKNTADFFKAYVELQSGYFFWNKNNAIHHLRSGRT